MSAFDDEHAVRPLSHHFLFLKSYVSPEKRSFFNLWLPFAIYSIAVGRPCYIT